MAYAGNQTLPGLMPVSAGVAGTAPRHRYYDVAAAYGSAIGIGNLLVKTATGLQLAGATPALGSVVGVAAENLAASTGGRIGVWDDPEQEFMIISDEDITDAEVISMVGRYAGIVAGTNVYSTTYRQGLTELDWATVTGTVTTGLPLQIVNHATNVGEVRTAADSQVRVKIGADHHVFSFGGNTV